MQIEIVKSKIVALIFQPNIGWVILQTIRGEGVGENTEQLNHCNEWDVAKKSRTLKMLFLGIRLGLDYLMKYRVIVQRKFVLRSFNQNDP